MCKFKNLCLLILCKVAMLPYVCQAKDQIITLSVAESIITHSDFTAYCLFEKTFKKMGYEVKQVALPLIRTISETQNGNMAMVLIGKITIDALAQPKTVEKGVVITPSPYSTEGIAITPTPYATMGIASYTLKNRNILMDEANWQSNYQIGLARNPHSHDIRTHDVKQNKNFHFYGNTLAAFQALLADRVDIVIASDLAYASSKEMLKLDDKVR